MNRSFYSVALALTGSLTLAFATSDVSAGGRWRNYDCQREGHVNPHADNLFMQNGIGWGKPFGDGPVATSIIRMENRVHPADPNPCLTVTRHGPFTTIR